MAKADEIKSRIARDIREGVYLPGSPLPTRHALMRKYGLARATVDKIVRGLCDDGLLVSTRGAGTYVASACDADRISAFVVLNTDVECQSSGMMEREWNFIINDVGARSRCALIGCHEFERFLPAIQANPQARLVWNRPAMRSYAAISDLHAKRKLQILINRSIPRYSFVMSDVRPALENAFKHISRIQPKATVAVLPPLLNPEEHYLAEREIMFYELAVAFGFRLITLPRTDSADHSGTIRIASAAIAKKPDYLYVPDYYMTPYVLAITQERGLRVGKDISLIVSDWNEAPQTTPGLIVIRQQWRQMFRGALDWALDERPEPMQLRIPCLVSINGKSS